MLVADGGGVLGWASLSPSPKPAYRRTAEVSVCVHRDARGPGVGKELPAALIDAAPRVGIAVLLSRVEASGVASLGLHEALGFNRIGTRHACGEKHGAVLDVVLLERQV